MKNLLNISLIALMISAVSACSGTRETAAVSPTDSTTAASNDANSASAGLTAPGVNVNTPDQPTGMASGNVQATLIDTISADLFLQQAAALAAKKMELGRIAQSKAQRPEIKAYAKMIVDEHSKVNTELQALAKSKNVELLAVGTDIKVDAEKLQAVEAASFDGAYTEIMVADHSRAVQLFESAAKSSDKELSAYAKKNLPTLRSHRTQAGDLNKR